MAKIRGRIGPYSRALAGGYVDGRTREGRFIKRMTGELNRHVGGEPSVAERALIGRIVRTVLTLGLLDERLAAGAATDHDARTFGGLQSALRAMLKQIGLKQAAPRSLSLAERLAARAAPPTPRGDSH